MSHGLQFFYTGIVFIVKKMSVCSNGVNTVFRVYNKMLYLYRTYFEHSICMGGHFVWVNNSVFDYFKIFLHNTGPTTKNGKWIKKMHCVLTTWPSLTFFSNKLLSSSFIIRFNPNIKRLYFITFNQSKFGIEQILLYPN